MKALFDFVKARDGEDAASALSRHLVSVDWKAYIARYHATQFHAILQSVIDRCKWIEKDDPPQIVASKLICFRIAEDPSVKLRDYELEANLIASAQSAHSVFDIFAHVLVHSFNIPRSQIKRQIGICSVLDAMVKGSIATVVTDLLTSTLESPSFLYLQAYVNTTKHHSLIRALPSAQFGPNPGGGVRIKAFNYQPTKKKPPAEYPATWAKDFLQSIDALLGDVECLGCTVNQALQIQSPGDAS